MSCRCEGSAPSAVGTAVAFRLGRRRAWALLALLPWLLLLAAPGRPTDDVAARASADVVLVREGEVVDEDLYAGGNSVTIEGTVEGDLIVWAFDRLDVSGTVTGDVVGYASSTSITGDVGGSVRLISLDLRVGGAVGGDVMGIAWMARSTGSVGRDLLAWSNTLDVDGDVGRDVEGQTLGATNVNGSIGRDFQMTVGDLTVGPGASVTQDVIFQAGGNAEISEAASIGGTVTQRSATIPNIRLSAVRFVSVLLGLLAFVWIGMLMVWLMPQTMQQATEAVSSRIVRSFFVGVVAFLLPVLLAASIITLAVLSPPDLALTILGIGAPVWLSLLVVLLLGVVLAPVPVAIAVGRRLLGARRSAFAAYLVGIILYSILLFVPYVGLPLAVLVAFVGLGALARGAVRARGSLRWATAQIHADDHGDVRSGRLLELDEDASSESFSGASPDEPEFFPRLAAVATENDDTDPDGAGGDRGGRDDADPDGNGGGGGSADAPHEADGRSDPGDEPRSGRPTDDPTVQHPDADPAGVDHTDEATDGKPTDS